MNAPKVCRIRNAMRQPLLLDPHNMLDAAAMAGHGFLYFGTGRRQPNGLASTHGMSPQ